MDGAALCQRDRLLLATGGIALVVLLCIARPWRYVDAFVYPPHAKMLLLPFAAMPAGAAVAIWTALNLFCLWRAGEMLMHASGFAVLASLPPAGLLMVATGYPGGFFALMTTTALAQGKTRPAMAGLSLALTTAHPQLALLLALLLLPFGYWRAVAIAAAWTLALLAASVITLGHEGWTDYLALATPQPMQGGAP